ncbi:MAG TPA: glycosyltransferase family 4 protein [Methanoregula sp.]|nr:glycosyltransferase family 4 protein [Methanoregula sp.]
MKIAFVYDVIYPYVKGGVEKRIHELALRLSARGHDVHIIGMKYWEGPDLIRKDGVTLHGICPAQPLYADGRRTIGEAINFSAHIIPFLRREEFDIIDCQQFPYFPCFPVKFSSVMKKKPFVITWHEVWGDYWYEYLGWKGVFGKITERMVAGFTQNRVSVSGTTAKKLHCLGVRDEVHIIPNGIDPGHIRSIPTGTKSSDLIFVGRLIKEKHVDVLVRAFLLLLKESPDRTLLILGDGPERKAITSLVKDLALEERVLLQPFLDSHDEVIGTMKASHVCVIPSTREGFGIAALEALACGLPVITVDHPDNAIRELITEETGFLASLSADDLADKIRVALCRYPEMVPACKASTETYDWDRIVDRAETYYQVLTAR